MFWERIVTFFIGGLYGLGLMISGITSISTVLGFLDLNDWDPTIAYFLATVVLFDFVAFTVLYR